jgi:wyosine [tRNA(Phe)-imidazoG37] synthetase (radical SAM superfamily)
VGKTTKLTTERMEYIKYEKVTGELTHFLNINPKIDYITFSGSGEPTLNIRIGDVLNFIKDNYPNIKTAVLTNGTLLSEKQVRDELLRADVILPSLDAAGEDAFNKINRPHPDLSLQKYIQGLIDLRKEYKGEIWLEVLFLKGYNDSAEELTRLKDAITKINPDKIQLNTLDRPGTLDDLQPLTNAEMQNIAEFFDNLNTEIIASQKERTAIESYSGNIESAILETISRRPCTLDDLHKLLGIHVNEINKYLGTLERNGKIACQKLERGVFYRKKTD